MGDPTKFGFGLIIAGFEIIHFAQHYILYRGAWMKKYKLNVECVCGERDCKHSRMNINVHDVVALPESSVMLKRVDYYV